MRLGVFTDVVEQCRQRPRGWQLRVFRDVLLLGAIVVVALLSFDII